MKLLSAALACALSLFVAAPAVGQDEQVDLVGTCSMTEIIGMFGNGTPYSEDAFVRLDLTIDKHDGPIFSGTMEWEVASSDLDVDDGTQVTTVGKETVVAVRSFDGTFIMIDTPDTSVHFIRLIDDDIMEAIGFETGEGAYASRAIYRRQ